MPYYMAGQAGFGGTWATTPAEAENASTPATAKQIADWINAGSLTDPSRHVQLLGQYPLTLVDTADWPDNTRAATARIPTDTVNYNPATTTYGRNILFGDRSDNTGGTGSTADGFTFEAVGEDANGFNVDMRGMTDNTERQAAAILIQGYDQTVTGWKVKCGDWNFIAPGRITTAHSGLPGGSSDKYAPEASEENCGLVVRGAWGSDVSANYVEGSDFTCNGLWVGFRTHSTLPNYNQGKRLRVFDNEAQGCGGANISVGPGSSISGATAATASRLPVGALVEVFRNLSYDLAFWGSSNAAMYHGNLLAVYGVNRFGGSQILVYDNDGYGNCQDGLVVLAVGARVWGNRFYETCPGYEGGDSLMMLVGVVANSGNPDGGWAQSSILVKGDGIKLGLGAYDGTAGANWLVPGTPVGAGFYVDECRNMAHGNRVWDTSGYAMTCNGSGGMLIAANELDNSLRGASVNHCLSLTGRTSVQSQQWVVNNYIKGPSNSLFIPDRVRAYAFNNISDSPTNFAQMSATGATLAGSRNVCRASTISVAAASQYSGWVNNTTATPGYVWGTGPTPGGNCDAVGDIYGLIGARTPLATSRDLAGRRWNASRLPIGPRQP